MAKPPPWMPPPATAAAAAEEGRRRRSAEGGRLGEAARTGDPADVDTLLPACNCSWSTAEHGLLPPLSSLAVRGDRNVAAWAAGRCCCCCCC